MQRYSAQALLCPDEWLIELQDIERQQATLDPPRPKSEPVVTPPAAVAIPRRFVSISRTEHQNGSHTVDAIDDEGIAWWMVPGETGWLQLAALPAREVPAQ